MIPLDDEMRLHLQHVENNLVNLTGGRVGRQVVAETVREAFDEIAESARIPNFIPVLVSRQAQLLLEAREIESGSKPKDFTTVLIICGTNRGRSQVATALMRFYAPGHISVVSAGQDPGEQVNPEVEAYLRTHGVELTDYPKRLRPVFVSMADHIVLMSNYELEVPQSKDVERWNLPHTSGLSDPEIETVVHQIDRHVRTFLHRILPDLALAPSIFKVRP